MVTHFKHTRSYAALRAADLGLSQLTWEGGGAGISKNVTHAGSQLTWEGGQGRNKQKRDLLTRGHN